MRPIFILPLCVLCASAPLRAKWIHAEVKHKANVGSAHPHICHPELVLALPAFGSRVHRAKKPRARKNKWTLNQVQGDVGGGQRNEAYTPPVPVRAERSRYLCRLLPPSTTVEAHGMSVSGLSSRSQQIIRVNTFRPHRGMGRFVGHWFGNPQALSGIDQWLA